MTPQERKLILENEYNISSITDFEKKREDMDNLGKFIYAKGFKQGYEQNKAYIIEAYADLLREYSISEDNILSEIVKIF